MKKLVMFLGVVALAGVASAASVNWQITNMRAPVAPDNLTIGSGNTAIATTDANLVMDLYIAASGTGSEELLLSGVALTGAGAMSQTELWDQTAAVAKRATYGNTVTLILRATYADASYTYAGEKSVSQSLENIESGLVNYKMNFAGVTWTATPVPEPTSGLLLLMGGALLGLRRKRA